MKLLTAAQMREADRLTTERFGVPSLQLMENAGTRIVEFLAEQFSDLCDRRILVLCGKGNNGGDGLVVARLLRGRGARPELLLFAVPDAVRGDAAINLKRWQDAGGALKVITEQRQWEAAKESLASAGLIVDALLGTGLTGPVEGLLAGVIEDVNARPRCAPVLAVDIPSGLSSDGAETGGLVIRADYTVTFTAPKVGQLLAAECGRVGRLVVRSIGTPPELLAGDDQLKLHWIEPGEFRGLRLVRDRAAHKGNYGHALLVAGSRGKSGAAVLGAWAALRVGVGLVTVATAGDVLPIVATSLPELMTEPLESTETGSISLRNLDYGRLEELMDSKSVLAMGPGLSADPETQQFVRTVLAECPLPVVLDADGLNAFAGRTDELQRRKGPGLAITPHPGEMARLMDSTSKQVQAQRLQTALDAAARWQTYVVLKGHHTIVAAPDGRTFINSTGNPGMATAGTGDVLTGMLAGLTAQFGIEDWARVLSLGVYLHGLAGDLAAERVGETPLMASDLIHALPEAYRRLLSDIDRAA